jgi:hypothetical protein
MRLGKVAIARQLEPMAKMAKTVLIRGEFDASFASESVQLSQFAGR